VEPTIFADVKPEHTIAQEEIFGPVLAIIRAKDYDDAMRIANDIPSAFVLHPDSTCARAMDFVYRAEAGLLTINLPSAGVEYQLPFGGTRIPASGPKEQGPAAFDFLQRLRPYTSSTKKTTVETTVPTKTTHTTCILDKSGTTAQSSPHIRGRPGRPIPAHTLTDLINRSDAEGKPLHELASRLASRHPIEASPLIPIHPAEVGRRLHL